MLFIGCPSPKGYKQGDLTMAVYGLSQEAIY